MAGAEGGGEPRAAWVWPLRLPRGVGAAAWSFSGLAAPAHRGAWWVGAAVAVGAAPLLACWAGGGSAAHQPASALLLLPLFLAAVRLERPGRAIGVVALAFAAHCAAAIACAATSPDVAAASLPGGADYWLKQRDWIRTGVDVEYEVATWLPEHVTILLGVGATGYLSLGLFPFLAGFHQADLMNYYVGRLLVESQGAGTALLLGWHPWSVARGLCYTVLAHDLAAASLARLTGRPLPGAAAGRRPRLAAALVLFGLDCGLKLVVSEPVRAALAANLTGPP
ncbi:MAG: hypothetical protein M9894_14380 [Planctomycetes bacterium]|nr:hypothetical protein [Planctomycetota bacterium]